MQYFIKLSLFFSNDCSHKHLVDTVSFWSQSEIQIDF